MFSKPVQLSNAKRQSVAIAGPLFHEGVFELNSRKAAIAALFALVTLGACEIRKETDADNTAPTEHDYSDAWSSSKGLQIEGADSPGRSGPKFVIGRLEVEVPPGWEQRSTADQTFAARFSQSDEGDAPTLAVEPSFGEFAVARVGLAALIGDIQIGTPGFRVHRTTDIAVPGATSAVRLDFNYGTEDTNGVFQGMWIVASDESTKESIAVVLSAPDPLDMQIADRVQSSLVMRPR